MRPYDPTLILRPTPAQLSTTFGDEAVILDTASGRYFSLDHVGELVWERLREAPQSVAALEAAVLERYEVEPERLRRDLQALIGELLAAGLVEIERGKPNRSPAANR